MIAYVIVVTIVSGIGSNYIAKKSINSLINTFKSIFTKCDYDFDMQIVDEYVNRVKTKDIRELPKLGNDSIVALIPVVNVFYTLVTSIKTKHEAEKLILKIQNDKYQFDEKEDYHDLETKIAYLAFAGNANNHDVIYMETILKMIQNNIPLSSSFEEVKEIIHDTHSLVKNDDKPVMIIDKGKKDLNIDKINYNVVHSNSVHTLKFEDMTSDMELDYLFDEKSLFLDNKKEVKILKKVLKK